MARPLITLIREALRDRLRQSQELAAFVGGRKDDPADTLFQGGRIFLNRFEQWDESELTTIGVYVLSEEPVESDRSPAPDERRLTLTVDILTTEDAIAEERLDLMAGLVEFYYTLTPLGRLIEAAGGRDTLLKIEWLGNERGALPEAGRTLMANVMTFALEYQLPAERPTLDDFRLAHTDWRAESAEGELVAEDLLDLPGWD